MKSLHVALLIIGSLLLGGCSGNSLVNLEDRSSAKVSQETSYVNATHHRKTMGDRIVRAHFHRLPAYQAMTKVARQVGKKVDNSFVPSFEYRTSLNTSMTLKRFLSILYMSTGVRYEYRNGMFRVTNSKMLDSHYVKRICSGANRLNISLGRVSPPAVFAYFNKSFGYSFEFDDKFGYLSSSVKGAKFPAFFYKGCDPREALREYAKTANLSIRRTESKRYSVSDYQTSIFELPVYFAQKFMSGGASLGENTGGTSKVFMTEDFKKGFGTYLATHLTQNGKVYISNRGYATVTDRPNNVKAIRKLISKEVLAQSPVKISVSVIRVDMKDGYSSGIDWNVALGKIGKIMDMVGFQVGIGTADRVQGGIGIGGGHHGKQQLVKFLGQYGNAKIVRDFSTTTRSGMMNTFRAVQEIPYMISKVVPTQAGNVVTTEAKVATAGLIINIMPTLYSNGNYANLSTDILVSEYLGDKIIKVNGGEYKLPKISKNEIQMPARIKMGQSMVLTGFKLKNRARNDEGIPGLVNKGIFGTLFGTKEDTKTTSEFVVVVTPERAY